MKAVVFPRYGDYRVLQFVDRMVPEPRPGEIRIRVTASSINKADWYYVAGSPFPIRLLAGGLRRPRRNIPGIDFAGVVAGVGSRVSHFKEGDEVFGDASVSGFGTWAEYVCVKPSATIQKPSQVGFEAAACLPVAGVTALQGLLVHGGLRNGMRVLVSGASGGVGMFAVQLAKAYGAHVTALCRADKFESVKQFGADETCLGELESLASQGEIFDIVLDAAAYRPFADYRAVLGPKGRYVLAGGDLTQLIKVGLSSAITLDRGGKRFLNFICKPRVEDLEVLSQLVCEGKIRPFIDKIVNLPQASSGLEMMDQRRIRGKVVIQVAA